MTEPFKRPFRVCNAGVEDANGILVVAWGEPKVSQWLCDRLNAPLAFAPASTPDGWVPALKLVEDLLIGEHYGVKPPSKYDANRAREIVQNVRREMQRASPPPSTAPGVVSEEVERLIDNLEEMERMCVRVVPRRERMLIDELRRLTLPRAGDGEKEGKK